jgi:hypothetical protein
MAIGDAKAAEPAMSRADKIVGRFDKVVGRFDMVSLSTARDPANDARAV